MQKVTRTALVTGASRGIGLEVARGLRAAEWRVLMTARTEDVLRDAAREVGGEAIPADVSDPGAVAGLATEVTARLGGAPDAIVHSAGSFALAPFADTSVEEFDRQIAANLRAPFLVTRAFLPALVERGNGHLVTIGSISGRLALPGNAAYSAAKFGLSGLHAVLVAELGGTGVRATMIEPAATDTSLWDEIDPDRRDDLPARSQMMRPEAVARAVIYALEQPDDVEVTHVALRAAG